MILEDRKFLDLDHVCDQIISKDDRIMFDEAIRCYQIGSHRAAIILAWSATADCLARRIDELASEGDGTAQQANRTLQPLVGQARYEETLIAKAKECELFDEYEEKCLRFARDTRSKCAHPTGVIPAAETVRHILHSCSQIVLCRSGYRGMSFVKHFIQTKLEDRYLFVNRGRATEDCRYYFDKVSEKVHPQFAACVAEHVIHSSPHWKENAFVFLGQLLRASSDETATKIVLKLESIETKDREFFSILVGLDEREVLWDDQVRRQAQSHLRDILRRGVVEEAKFHSYANICALVGLDDADKELFRTRFSQFISHFVKHHFIQTALAKDLISLVVEALDDIDIREQILRGLPEFVTAEIFTNSGEPVVEQIALFATALIQENWRDDGIRDAFQQGGNWPNALKVAFLERSEDFLLECSEDFPDDIITIFEIAGALLTFAPTTLPAAFESSLQNIVNGTLQTPWYDERGDTYRNFIGQADLLKIQHREHLSVLSTLEFNVDELDEMEEYG